MKIETLNALKILAIRAAERPTEEDYYRRICRWFSREFSTPLKEVESYSEEYVIRHYLEEQVRRLASATDESTRMAYENLKADFLMTEEERKIEENEIEDWMKQLEDEVAASHAKIQELQQNVKNLENVTANSSFDPNLIREGFVAGETQIPSDSENIK